MEETKEQKRARLLRAVWGGLLAMLSVSIVLIGFMVSQHMASGVIVIQAAILLVLTPFVIGFTYFLMGRFRQN